MLLWPLLCTLAGAMEMFDLAQGDLREHSESITSEQQLAGEQSVDLLEEFRDADWQRLSEVTFNAPDSFFVKATQVKHYRDELGQEHWVGTIVGDPLGILVLTRSEKAISATLNAFGKISSLVQSQVGHVVMDRPDLKPSGDGIELSTAAAAKLDPLAVSPLDVDGARVSALSGVSQDSPTTIDILVVYTANAAARYTSITTQIANEIAYTNQALDRSCTKTQIRVVGTQEVTYSDASSTLSASLRCVANTADGCLDDVPTLRDSLGADLVQFWVQPNTLDFCGLAYVYTPGQSSSIGYSTKAASCSASTTAHEIGHNLGLFHDPYETGDGPQSGRRRPHHGHVDLGTKVRTIMAYADQCNAQSIRCPEVSYFSNPRIIYQGNPLGRVAVSDAAKTVVQNKAAISAFRSEVSAASTPNFTLCAETTEDSSGLGGGCFVVTASSGDFDHPRVKLFRVFRDEVLRKLPGGEYLIRFYYKYSPLLADLIDKDTFMRSASRSFLDFLAGLLTRWWVAIGLLFGVVVRSPLAVLIAAMYSTTSYGVVASIPIDQLRPLENVAGVAMKKAHTVVGVARAGYSGETKVNTTVEDQEDSSSFLITGRMSGGKWAGNAYLEPSKEKTFSTVTGNGNVEREEEESDLRFGLSRALSSNLGIGVQLGIGSIEYPGTGSFAVTREKKRLMLTPGASYRLGNFMVGGLLRIERLQETNVETGILYTLGAGGAWIKQTGSTLIRLEGSIERSPESISLESEDGPLIRKETQILRADGEIVYSYNLGFMDGIYLGFLKELGEYAGLGGASSADVSSDRTRIGLGLRAANKKLLIMITRDAIAYEYESGLEQEEVILTLGLSYGIGQ